MSAVQPLISVVITCFNYARYVGGAIESVISQEYSKKQIIVVNDGSTDESMGVIAPYADRVRIIDQVNQGAQTAYNNGFAATTGDVVIFLDADDVLEPGALAEVAMAWSPSVAKVQYDLKIIDANGRDLGRRFCHFTEDYDARRVRESFKRTGTYRWPVTVGNAYSRWFAQSVLPLSDAHLPDGVLNTVAPVYGEVITIPRTLASYRLHGANGWSSNGTDHSRLAKRVLQRHLEVAIMRRHAEKRGVRVPDVNVLDHELPFIGYRLMALKLGHTYWQRERDSAIGLIWRAYRVVVAERLPFRLGFAHVAWCVVVAVAPRPVATAFIRLRFNRAAIGRSLRRRLRVTLARQDVEPRTVA